MDTSSTPSHSTMTSFLSRTGLAALAVLLCLSGCDSGGDFSSELDQAFNCNVGTIALGATVSGTISSSDCDYLDNDGTYADYYAFTLSSTTSVVITQTSDEVDSFISLYDDTAHELDFDDDGGTGLDSRLERTLGAGTYVIAANTNGVQEGAYMLALRASVGG